MKGRHLTDNWAPIVLPLLVLGVGGWLLYDFSLPPFEDAAMLMRYADHLADGYGIVWNPGGPAVDGATDFLFMCMVAALHKLGVTLEGSVRLLTSAAHLLTIVLVYGLNLRASGGPLMPAITATCVAAGPGLLYVEALFGTPVFALAGLLCYAAFARLLVEPERPWSQIGFASAALTTGLIRPEGVILALGMLVALWFKLDTRRFVPILRAFLILFGLPGAIYFLWHWAYFGHPLPNPFYVKGGGTLHLDSLRKSITHVVILSLPLVPLFGYCLWSPRVRRTASFHLLPVLVFTLAWVLLSNAMNYGMRFQYVLLPIMLVAWGALARHTRHHASDSTDEILLLRGSTGWGLMAYIALALVVQLAWFNYGRKTYPDGRLDVARALVEYRAEGYTMAVTEAGILPLYSGWRAIDTWGLNDLRIAHGGQVTAEYLDEYRPELIMIHDFWSPGVEKRVLDPSWAAMTGALERYVAERNYELVASFGVEPDESHFYYLRRDFADFESLRELIRNLDYSWYKTGQIARNFATEWPTS